MEKNAPRDDETPPATREEEQPLNNEAVRQMGRSALEVAVGSKSERVTFIANQNKVPFKPATPQEARENLGIYQKKLQEIVERRKECDRKGIVRAG